MFREKVLTYTCRLRCLDVASFLTLFVSFISFANAVGPEQVVVYKPSLGISAELIDYDDFYYHANGSRIRLLRKEGIFAVDARGISAKELQDKLKSYYKNQVDAISVHRLGSMTVVQLKPSKATKQNPNLNSHKPSGARAARMAKGLDRSTLVDINSLKSVDRRIQKVSQVFANSQGQGNLVLRSKITFKLATEITNEALNRLLSINSLRLERKLRLNGHVYSATLINQNLTPTQQLAIVRSLASQPTVLWAEPQFISKPFKTSFEPNDTLFASQWHLRDRGFRGSRCDTDCDANDAWGLSVSNGAAATRGEGVVIAIVDDGVQLDHPDLAANMFLNQGELSAGDFANGTCSNGVTDLCSNGVDDDGNGFVDDWRGWDFVDDSATNPNLQNANFDGSGTCTLGVDGQPGADNDPSPQATVNCSTVNGDPVSQDDHGTAVAGIAAAVGNNSEGVAGIAFNSQILPLRVISDFDSSSNSSFCTAVAEAIAYAGRYADVINNSWGMNDTCMALEDTIADVVSGQVAGGNTSAAMDFKRPNLGSPVIFSSGNSASGWVKITVPVTAGEHAYEWRFLRSAFPGSFNTSTEDDSVWLDEITFPDNSVEGFEGDLSAFENDIALNLQCDANCTSFLFAPRPIWSIESDVSRVFSGSQSILLDASGADCGNSYLSVLREDPAGEISFWVRVSTNLEADSDKFEFLIDGKEVISYGDIAAFVDNAVAYPANLADTIAVGASVSGDLSGLDSPSATSEMRVFYSQFGAELDLLASSSDQHIGIATTDRNGVNDGFNRGVNSADFADDAYTNTFGGTSASAPQVAGAAAAVLAVNPTLSAAGVRGILRDSADKVGPLVYDNSGSGRNNEAGFGRLNLMNALRLANGDAVSSAAPDCNAETFDYTAATDLVLSRFSPAGQMCSALGALPQLDDLCIPIKASNGKVAVICI